MKYLYLIPILFLFACPAPKEELYKVEFGIKEKVYSGARLASLVPDFDDKYGLVDLTASNTVYTSKFYQEQNTGDIVRFITLPLGNYDFYMDSEGNIPFNEFQKFSSFANSDVPTAGVIELSIDNDQALILIKKTLDEIPTIEVSGANSSSYPVLPFYEDSNYYYMYCYGSWGYEIKYLLSGLSQSIIRTFENRKVYLYEFGGTGIGLEEGYTEVIVNQ